jgi:hypothetical protein
MIGWLVPGDGDPADYRVPVIVAALFVLIPAAMVPVMGFGAIATSTNGGGWVLMAGTLAALGALGTVLVVAGAAAAATLTRPPIPAMLVAAGTTLALIAGILLVPVLMAGLAA